MNGTLLAMYLILSAGLLTFMLCDRGMFAACSCCGLSSERNDGPAMAGIDLIDFILATNNAAGDGRGEEGTGERLTPSEWARMARRRLWLRRRGGNRARRRGQRQSTDREPPLPPNRPSAARIQSAWHTDPAPRCSKSGPRQLAVAVVRGAVSLQPGPPAFWIGLCRCSLCCCVHSIAAPSPVRSPLPICTSAPCRTQQHGDGAQSFDLLVCRGRRGAEQRDGRGRCQSLRSPAHCASRHHPATRTATHRGSDAQRSTAMRNERRDGTTRRGCCSEPAAFRLLRLNSSPNPGAPRMTP